VLGRRLAGVVALPFGHENRLVHDVVPDPEPALDGPEAGPIYVRRLFSKCCDHSPLPANDFGLASRRVTVKPRSRMVVGESGEAPYGPLICVSVEPMTGIEPAYSAWEVDSFHPSPSVTVRTWSRAAEMYPCKYGPVQGGRR
jgi:hypothetical protein